MAMRTGNRQSGGIQSSQAKLSEKPAVLALDLAMDKELRAHITQRKEAMSDAWH